MDAGSLFQQYTTLTIELCKNPLNNTKIKNLPSHIQTLTLQLLLQSHFHRFF